MATHTINFITWNINGLKLKLDQKYQILQHADVVFLQETHIRAEYEDIIEDLKNKWHVFFTKYTSRMGTAILVRKTLNFIKISNEIDNCGAYVVLKCRLEGQPYTLVSVYNHHKDAKTLDNLSRYLQSMTIGLLVIGGDFNTVLNPFIDKGNSTVVKDSTIHKRLRFCAEMFMKSLQLVDVWRRKNPRIQEYTFRRNDSASRLDYFFVPGECMWRVKSCIIRDSGMCDHFPVYLEITNAPPTLINPDTQLTQLNAKIDALTKEMGSSLDEESIHAVSEADIVSAVNSLQVSDTPRPDGIEVSIYKDNIQKVIPYIKMLYDRIHRGTFKCSEKHFNETVKIQDDDSQHFFNVDYLIIATVLTKRLDDFLESQSNGHKQKKSTIMITPKTCNKIRLSRIKNEIKKHKLSNPTLYQDFLFVKKLLKDAPEVDTEPERGSTERDKLLDQGCPLTPVLIMLALKSFVSELYCNGILVFKESLILSIQPEDFEKVIAEQKERAEEYDIMNLSKGTVNESKDEARNEEEQSEAGISVDGDEGENEQLKKQWKPLQKFDDVKKLSDSLAKDRRSEELVEYLSQPVNLDLNYVVGKVMNRLFAKHALSHFNWKKKREGKESFSKLQILDKIIEAVQHLLPGQSSDSIEQEIKNQFKNYTK